MDSKLILLVIGCVLLAATYFYWRHLAITIKSLFVAYDLIIVSLLVSFLVARLLSVAVDTSFRLTSDAVWLELFSAPLTNLVYVAVLFIPAIVYSVYMFRINRQLEVTLRTKTSQPLIWGGVLMLGIEIYQLFSGINTNWPAVFVQFHLSRILLLVLVIGVTLFLFEFKQRQFRSIWWFVVAALIYIPYFIFGVVAVGERQALGSWILVLAIVTALSTNQFRFPLLRKRQAISSQV